MKNLFYSLCLLIGFSSWATSVDNHMLSLNSNDIDHTSTTSSDCDLNALYIVNQDVLADESFEFDTTKYLPTNFNAYAGLFEEHEFVQAIENQAFDFDTEAYLPVGFNATIQFEYEVNAIATGEEDIPFDFETANYFPIGFNAALVLDTEAYELATIEEDIAFDFNTANYLPVGFNTNAPNYDTIEEIAITEEDESLEFDTMQYLPEDFDAKDSRLVKSTLY
jgi:hypothetical protein